MRNSKKSNSRIFDQGLLVTIQKSIIKDIKRNDSTKEDFASEIGITKGTLENKWTFSNKINDFTIHELIHIMELTGDTSPLEYIGHMFDMAVISTNTENVTSVEELNRLTDEAQMQCSEAFSSVKKASQDGIYTADEISEMKKQSLEAIEAEQKKLDAINKLKPSDTENEDEWSFTFTKRNQNNYVNQSWKTWFKRCSSSENMKNMETIIKDTKKYLENLRKGVANG